LEEFLLPFPVQLIPRFLVHENRPKEELNCFMLDLLHGVSHNHIMQKERLCEMTEPNIFAFTLTQENLPTLGIPLAKLLRIGDVVCLWGNLGAGKTTFARVLIQSLAHKPVEVPSPTFTLVQIYDTSHGEVWHCDLYRLNNPEEVFELGLEEAFHEAICLLEWPERLGDLLPQQRIDIAFHTVNETTRAITVTLVGPHDLIQSTLSRL
jgi:tRNA threonylcarbamoyladenosine biosynthesis protein TsaE